MFHTDSVGRGCGPEIILVLRYWGRPGHVSAPSAFPTLIWRLLIVTHQTMLKHPVLYLVLCTYKILIYKVTCQFDLKVCMWIYLKYEYKNILIFYNYGIYKDNNILQLVVVFIWDVHLSLDFITMINISSLYFLLSVCMQLATGAAPILSVCHILFIVTT